MLKQLLKYMAVLVGGLAGGLAGVFPGQASAADLVSHRAFYSILLSETKVADIISSVGGVMVTSLERTCDGWVFTQDMKTVIGLQSGGELQQSALFTSWESLDSNAYRFASRISTGDSVEVLKGRADMEADGSGTAHYSQPEVIDVALPEGTLFPVSHTAGLIAEAEAGKRHASHVVFTGSGSFEPELVNTFIGAGTLAANHGHGLAQGFADSTGWPLTMSFHELKARSGVPLFEMRAFQMDNGLSPSLHMSFGEFSTDMKIERIEIIDNPVCG